MIAQCFLKSIWKICRLILVVACVGILANAISLFIIGKIYFAPTIPISVFVGILISIRFIEHEPFSKTGIEFHIRDILYVLIGVITVVMFYSAATAMECFIQGENLFPLYVNRLISGLGRSVISVLLIPISEEMLWRGYVLGNTFDKLKHWQKNIISALIFSMLHWFYIPGTGLVAFFLINVVSTVMIGLVLGNVRFLTRSIWCGVAIHWMFNYLGLCVFSGNNPTNTFVLVTIIASAIGYCFIEKTLKKQAYNNSLHVVRL